MSNVNFAAVAARSASQMRGMAEKIASLEQENLELKSRLASLAYEGEVYDLAKDMEDKGLNADMTFEEKVASIRGTGNLENVRQAVKMASAGGLSFGDLSDIPNSVGRSSFESFCLGVE